MAKIKLTKAKASPQQQLRGVQRIEALDPEIRDVVDSLIYEGETDYAIRVRLLTDWSGFEDMAPRTLDRAIEKYRNSESGLERQMALEAQAARLSVSRFDKDVDVLSELQRITMMQKERLMKAHIREEDSPLLLDMVSKEMGVYKTLLTETGKLQLELGILQKAPKKITGIVPGLDGRPVQFSWTEEQDALLSVVDHAAKA